MLFRKDGLIHYMKNDFEKVFSSTSKFTKSAVKTISKQASSIKTKAVEKASESKDIIKNTVDQNGDGQITIEDIIIMGLKAPGIKIDRSEFLKKEFKTRYSDEIIEQITKYNPAHENVPLDEINKIADEVIKYERLCVSGISTALGMPGGVSVVATLPTDIAQYYGYMLRAAQKLLYLYGFPEINVKDAQLLDSETMNTLIICLGVMYGVAGANTALKSMAKALGLGVEKKLVNKALTKGTIYPIVKSIAKWFDVKLTKEVFAGFFKKTIPVVGGVVGGGITYISFKPCCEKLKDTLQNTILSNPKAEDDEDLIQFKDCDITNE